MFDNGGKASRRGKSSLQIGIGSSPVSNQGDPRERTIVPNPEDGVLKTIKGSAWVTIENTPENEDIVNAFCDKVNEQLWNRGAPQNFTSHHVTSIALTKKYGSYDLRELGRRFNGRYGGTIKFPNDASEVSGRLASASKPIDRIDRYKIKLDGDEHLDTETGEPEDHYVITPQSTTMDTRWPDLHTQRYFDDWMIPLAAHIDTFDRMFNRPGLKAPSAPVLEETSRPPSSLATSDRSRNVLGERRDRGTGWKSVPWLKPDGLGQKLRGWRDSGSENVKRLWANVTSHLNFGSHGEKASKASVRWGKSASRRTAVDETDRGHIAGAEARRSARADDHADSAQASREDGGSGATAPKHLSFWVQNQKGEWEKWTSKKNGPPQCDGLFCSRVSGSMGNDSSVYGLIDVRFTNQGQDVTTNGECLSLALEKDPLRTTEGGRVMEQAVGTGEGVTINPEDGAVRLAEQAPLRPLLENKPPQVFVETRARRAAAMQGAHPNPPVLSSAKAATHNRKTSRTQ